MISLNYRNIMDFMSIIKHEMDKHEQLLNEITRKANLKQQAIQILIELYPDKRFVIFDKECMDFMCFK